MLRSDGRLEQRISIRTPAEQLTAMLADLRHQTGVQLGAGPPMGDTVLVARFDGTLREWMIGLAQFFAASKEERPVWSHFGPPGRYRWILQRDIVTARAVDRLREAREEHLAERLRLLARARSIDEREWNAWKERDPQQAAVMREGVSRANSGAQVIWHMMELPPQAQETLREGGHVTYRPADLAKGADPTRYIQQWLGPGLPKNMPPDEGSRVTFYTTGHGSQRGFFIRVDTGRAGRGLSTCTGITFGQLFPDLDRDHQGQQWRDRLGVAADAPSTPIPLSDAAPQRAVRYRNGLPRVRSVIWRVAEQTKANLIAEDYGWKTRANSIGGRLSMGEILNRLCNPPVNPTLREDGSGYFWWRSGGIYMLRSLAWPEDELLNVPYRFVEGWKASRSRHGYLQVDDLAEMAALNRDSLPILTAWFPEAESLPEAQAPLRWYLHAPPAVRRQVFTETGASLAELGVDTGRALEGLDPAAMEPDRWSPLLRRYQPGDIRMSILYGHRTRAPDGSEQSGVGVIFHDPASWSHPERQRVVVVPLAPSAPMGQ